MSNPKTAIQEIKSLMVKFGFISDEPTLASFKLEDNTIVETLKLEAGSKITKVSDEFERVELESGSYRLVENFEIEVENGTITSVKQIFVDAKLVDGTQIKVEGDSLMEGAKVVVVTEEGELPAPDGVHELEDGTKVETKEGVIARIEEKVAEAEGPEVEIELADVEVEGPKGSEVQVETPDPMAEFVALVKDMMEKISEKMKSMEDKVESMNAEFNAFKKEPAGKKISDGKTDFNKQSNSDDVIADRLAAIAAMRKK
jgi:preprotein translocase subunit YajC